MGLRIYSVDMLCHEDSQNSEHILDDIRSMDLLDIQVNTSILRCRKQHLLHKVMDYINQLRRLVFLKIKFNWVLVLLKTLKSCNKYKYMDVISLKNIPCILHSVKASPV